MKQVEHKIAKIVTLKNRQSVLRIAKKLENLKSSKVINFRGEPFNWAWHVEFANGAYVRFEEYGNNYNFIFYK